MSSVNNYNNYYSMSKPITVNTDFDRPAMPPILKMVRNSNNTNHANSNHNNTSNQSNTNTSLPIPHSVNHMHGVQQHKKSRNYQTLLNNANLLTAVSTSNSATNARIRPHFSLTDETTTSNNSLSTSTTNKRFQFQSRQQKLLKEQFDSFNQQSNNSINSHHQISSASSEPSNLNVISNGPSSTKHLNWIKSNVSPQLVDETDHLSKKLSLSSLANTFPGFYLNPNETNYTKLINSILTNKMKTSLSTSSLSTQTQTTSTTTLPSSTSSSALSNTNYNSSNNKSPNMKSINEIDEMSSNSNFNINHNNHNNNTNYTTNNSTLPQFKFDTTSLLINSLNESLLATSQSNLKNYDVSYRLNNLRKSSNHSLTTSNSTIVSFLFLLKKMTHILCIYRVFYCILI